MAIQHVSIGVHDLDTAIEFYGWLGLTQVANRPNFGVGGVWLQAAVQQVHLIVTDKPTPGLENHFAFITDDLDVALTELASHGVTAFRTSHVPGAGRQGFLNDPSGNVIELNQPD